MFVQSNQAVTAFWYQLSLKNDKMSPWICQKEYSLFGFDVFSLYCLRFLYRDTFERPQLINNRTTTAQLPCSEMCLSFGSFFWSRKDTCKHFYAPEWSKSSTVPTYNQLVNANFYELYLACDHQPCEFNVQVQVCPRSKNGSYLLVQLRGELLV